MPILLIRFYRGESVRGSLRRVDEKAQWLEGLPAEVLVLGLLSVFYALAQHAALFTNGTYPLYGAWLVGLNGMLAVDISILLLAGTAWGILRRAAWAWWVGAFYYAWTLATTVVTLSEGGYQGMLAAMNFPEYERTLLGGMPLQGWHLALFVGLPLAATLGLLLASRRRFSKSAL